VNIFGNISPVNRRFLRWVRPVIVLLVLSAAIGAVLDGGRDYWNGFAIGTVLGLVVSWVAFSAGWRARDAALRACCTVTIRAHDKLTPALQRALAALGASAVEAIKRRPLRPSALPRGIFQDEIDDFDLTGEEVADIRRRMGALPRIVSIPTDDIPALPPITDEDLAEAGMDRATFEALEAEEASCRGPRTPAEYLAAVKARAEEWRRRGLIGPECPQDCSACSGETCGKCGAGCWAPPGSVRCAHDVIDRHGRPGL
jgi:hypothetical protein